MPALCENKPTIIIAAYNEERLIRDTLLSLGSGYCSSFQLLVICNGCSDNTVEIIEGEFPEIHYKVIETASKALSIRYAESLNIGFPRLYLDADILLDCNDAEQLFKLAQASESPTLFIPASSRNTATSSSTVNEYYNAWYLTGYVKQLGFGCGAYLLNQSARARFGTWPNIISDDGFLRTQFSINEITIVKNICVKVHTPKTLHNLIKIKTRSKLGNIELNEYLRNNKLSKKSHALTHQSMSLKQKTIYSIVNVIALLNAYWNIITGSTQWHRDNSNR